MKWGRKSRDCHKFGICRFVIGICAGGWSRTDWDAHYDVLDNDPKISKNSSKYMMVIPVTDDMIANGDTILYVDEDILTEYNGATYTMLAGQYTIQKTGGNGSFVVAIN